METLGLIGGMGPESTIAYYRRIVRKVNAETNNARYPDVVVISVDMFEMLRLMESGDFESLASFLALAVRKAAKAGTSFAAIAACTPHVVIQPLQSRCSIPLVSIVDVTVDDALRRGFTTVSVIGSRFTMQGEFFLKAFEKRGVQVVMPSVADQEYIHSRYFSELVKGVVKPETRDAFNQIMLKMRHDYEIEAVVLAGTELALLYEDSQGLDIPLLDATAIHVECLVQRLLANTISAQSPNGGMPA